jgi:hypothetical protein
MHNTCRHDPLLLYVAAPRAAKWFDRHLSNVTAMQGVGNGTQNQGGTWFTPPAMAVASSMSPPPAPRTVSLLVTLTGTLVMPLQVGSSWGVTSGQDCTTIFGNQSATTGFSAAAAAQYAAALGVASQRVAVGGLSCDGVVYSGNMTAGRRHARKLAGSSSSSSGGGDEYSRSAVRAIAQAAAPFTTRRLQQAPLNVTVNLLVTFVQPNSTSSQVVVLPAAPGDLVLVPNSVLQDLRQGRLSQQPQAHAVAVQQLSSVQPGSILAGAAQQTLSGRTTDVTAQVWALDATSTITSAYVTTAAAAWQPFNSNGAEQVTLTNSSSMQHAAQGPFGSGVPCSTSIGQCGGEGYHDFLLACSAALWLVCHHTCCSVEAA